jgi:prepilin-type N-terminal cleavage/methylation domain-containing protein
VFGIARKNKVLAFSLIELIIVIAIIGLMAAIVVPNLQIFKKRQAIFQSLQLLIPQIRANCIE